MTMGVYSVKDVKVGFMSPFTQVNDAVAVRSFRLAVNDKSKNVCNEAPEDKELWKLGDFDDITGTLTSNPLFLTRAVDVQEVSHE